MKYEIVFGDDGLFFDAQKDCEMVGNGHHKVENGKLMVWNFTEKRWCNSHTNTITISAMRRIIKEPKRWTVEDQKAGRLPEVGSKFLYKDEELCCHYVDNNGEVWANNFKGEVVTPWLREITPIESPEEKAKRSREEWCRKCKSQFYPGGSNGFPEMIYDALLSGELPMPSKDGE